MLFDNYLNKQNLARQELTNYFEMIASATLGDIEIFDNQSYPTPTLANKKCPNSLLTPPSDQELRDMRHHQHCKELEGVIGTCKDVNSNTISYAAADLVKLNTETLLPKELVQKPFTKGQLNMMAYTFPYNMKAHDSMKPSYIQPDNRPATNIASFLPLDEQLNLFQLRYPLFQMRFNNHDFLHRKTCFKKGCECRGEFPKKHQKIAEIYFDKNKYIDWVFVDGSTRRVCPFQYLAKCNIGD